MAAGGFEEPAGFVNRPRPAFYASVEQEASCENLSGRPPAAHGYQCGFSSCRVGSDCAYVTGLRRMPVDIAERSVCSPG
jgi:hypothetical protein